MSSNKSSAIFPGSFDPLTNGHLDIITRSLQVFERVVVAILSNTEKSSMFSVGERVDLISQECASFGARVEVKTFSGLLAEFARQNQIRVIVRGLRAVSDYDYEAQMALMNQKLWDEVETFFLMAREENSYISSTLVKGVAKLRGDISRFVPPSIAAALAKKIS